MLVVIAVGYCMKSKPITRLYIQLSGKSPSPYEEKLFLNDARSKSAAGVTFTAKCGSHANADRSLIYSHEEEEEESLGATRLMVETKGGLDLINVNVAFLGINSV